MLYAPGTDDATSSIGTAVELRRRPWATTACCCSSLLTEATGVHGLPVDGGGEFIDAVAGGGRVELAVAFGTREARRGDRHRARTVCCSRTGISSSRSVWLESGDAARGDAGGAAARVAGPVAEPLRSPPGPHGRALEPQQPQVAAAAPTWEVPKAAPQPGLGRFCCGKDFAVARLCSKPIGCARSMAAPRR